MDIPRPEASVNCAPQLGQLGTYFPPENMARATLPSRPLQVMTAAVKPISKKIENQFERLVISASGKIPDYNHGDKQAMVEECGAKFERMNIGECTHLITTAECYHGENVPAKIIKAQKSASCDIVSIDWLLASTKAKAPLNTRGFLIRALGSKRLVSTSSNSNPKPARKRKLSIGSSQSPRQRRKGENDRVLANRDKLSALVDKASNAGDSKNLCVWTDKNDIVYDATMVENLSASASPAKSETTSVKIIQIQLIVDIDENTYHTRIRETEVRCPFFEKIAESASIKDTVARKGDGQFSSAVGEFETAIKRFTGLAWSGNSKRFRKGKAVVIELEDKDSRPALDTEVCGALSKFVNLQNWNAIKGNLLKPFSKKLLESEKDSLEHSLQTGIGILNKLKEVSDRGKGKGGFTSAKGLVDTLRQSFFRLFWPTNTPLPAPEKTICIESWRRLIEDLRDYRAIEYAPKKTGQPNPSLMRHVLGLLHLEEMISVSHETDEYGMLVEYFTKSSGMWSVTVLNVFRIKRLREAMQFSRWREDHKSVLSERRLLWHGSMVSNFAGILRHGFHIGPSKGIFFADWAEKSVSFCRVTKGNNAFMLLCEVEFGRVSGQWGAGDSFIHDGLSHTTWSDAASVHPDLKGVNIPEVHPKDNTNAFTKEYVVMNPAQIRQRYIFHFKLS